MKSKWEHLFTDEDVRVKKSMVTLEDGTKAYRFFSKSFDISDMLFIKNSKGDGYIPVLTNYKNINGYATGEPILKKTIEFDFILSVKESLKEVNQQSGKVKYGNFTILQWYIGIQIVKSAIKYQRKKYDVEIHRQLGKTHLLSHIAGFLPVFAPLYADLINDRWWQIIASYTEESVKEIFDLKVKPVILKNIELFNKIYPSNPLVYGRVSGENFTNTNMKFEIRRMMNNVAIPYSYVIALSTNKISDGKSSDWLWLDESWRTDAKEFRRGILPFIGSTGADAVYTGVSTVDKDNMMHYIHFNVKDSIKYIINIFTSYNFLKEDAERRAENLRGMAEDDFSSAGIDSSEVQTNWLLTWDILDGMFYSRELLKNNNNYAKENSFQVFKNDKEFRVAGLDLATINDYCVLSIFDVYKITKSSFDEITGQREYKEFYNYRLKEIITYNLDRNPLSAEDIAKRTAEYCNTYEIDMIMCDGTTSQRTHNEWILKQLREKNVNTLLCPYDFSGEKNKVLLMAYYEQILHSGLVQFGTEEECEKHESLSILITEIVNLYKGYEGGKRNMQYKSKGKHNTDDHVMSTALGVYCLPFIEYLISNNKDITINSYRYKPKLNKFNDNKIIEKPKPFPKRYMLVL